MSAVGYMTSERDWSKALDEAKSLETLQAVVAGWAPYVPDAQAVVDAMEPSDFERWRDCLAIERKGRFAGEEFAHDFGALLIPGNLIRGSQLADTYKVPLGTALIKLREIGKIPAGTPPREGRERP